MKTTNGRRTFLATCALSTKPGIGVDINEEGMRRYAIPGVPFFA